MKRPVGSFFTCASRRGVESAKTNLGRHTLPPSSDALDELLKTYSLSFKTIIPSSLRRYGAVVQSPGLEELIRTALAQGVPVAAWERRLGSTIRARDKGFALTAAEEADLRALAVIRAASTTNN